MIDGDGARIDCWYGEIFGAIGKYRHIEGEVMCERYGVPEESQRMKSGRSQQRRRESEVADNTCNSTDFTPIATKQ